MEVWGSRFFIFDWQQRKYYLQKVRKYKRGGQKFQNKRKEEKHNTSHPINSSPISSNQKYWYLFKRRHRDPKRSKKNKSSPKNSQALHFSPQRNYSAPFKPYYRKSSAHNTSPKSTSFCVLVKSSKINAEYILECGITCLTTHVLFTICNTSISQFHVT